MAHLAKPNNEYGIIENEEQPKAKLDVGPRPQLGKGMIGGGVFVIVDEEGVLWRIDAEVGTYRRCTAL